MIFLDIQLKTISDTSGVVFAIADASFVSRDREIVVVTRYDYILKFNLPYHKRYRRKSSKEDASIFDSALSHTRRSNVSEI